MMIDDDRAFRGSSWGRECARCYTNSRNWLTQQFRGNYVGFRVIKRRKP